MSRAVATCVLAMAVISGAPGPSAAQRLDLELPPADSSTSPSVRAGAKFFADSQYRSAFARFDAAARTGDRAAAIWLGYLYHMGLGTTRDNAAAQKWYLTAAKAGDAGAMANLGILYIRSSDHDHDYSRLAFEWFQKAAAAGSGLGMAGVGWCYEHGYAGTSDLEEATKWFRSAAAAGSPLGMIALGDIAYFRIVDAHQDHVEAAAWYRKAAAAGSAEGMVKLADLYVSGSGVFQSDSAAAKLYSAAARIGDADGMLGYAKLLDRGKGVANDDSAAALWYRRAASLGSAAAAFRLGVLYYEGRGVPRDYTAAAAWYLKTESMEQRPGREIMEGGDGRRSAAVRLAVLYELGRGVPQDYPAAILWYRSAVQSGSTDAMYRLGVIYDRGLGVPQSDSAAFFWYERAATGYGIEGMAALGLMYARGRGVAEDTAKAMSWFAKAAATGFLMPTDDLSALYSGSKREEFLRNTRRVAAELAEQERTADPFDCPATPGSSTPVRIAAPQSLAGHYVVHQVRAAGTPGGRPSKRQFEVWLWPSSALDSSLRLHQRAAPGDTVKYPLFGATRGYVDPGERENPAPFRSQIDALTPQVLVADQPGWNEENLHTLVLLIGTVSSRRTDVIMLDGAGIAIYIQLLTPTGFRGTWGSWGIVNEGGGYYCAERID